MTSTKTITADELLAMGEDCHCELLNGVLREMSPSGGRHSEIAAVVVGEVSTFARRLRLGRTYTAEGGFILQRNPDTVFAPGAAFVRADRLPPPEQREGFLPLAPDLVIEVLSPSDSRREAREKVQVYLQSGVNLLWLVDPRSQSVTEFRPGHAERVLSVDDTLDGGEVLPGFQLRLVEVFEE